MIPKAANQLYSVGRPWRAPRSTMSKSRTTRRAVATFLVEGPAHPSAEDLLTAVQSTCPDVAPSTVYRILEDLEDLGVVVHVHLGHSSAIYHLAAQTHGHLMRPVRDGDRDPGRSHRVDERRIRDRLGFIPAFRHFSVTGLCLACDAAPEIDVAAISRAPGPGRDERTVGARPKSPRGSKDGSLSPP